MKTKLFGRIVIAILLAIGVSAGAKAQTRLLADLPDGEGVEKVFVSKSMMNLAMDYTEYILSSIGDYAKIFEEVDYIEFYECTNPDLTQKVETALDKMLKGHHIEVLLESIESDESVYIYLLSGEKEGSKPTALALINKEKNGNGSSFSEISVVILHGKNLNLKKLEQ